MTKRSDEDLDRPLRLVSVPALVGLILALLIILGGAFWLFGGQVAVRVPASGVIVNPPENVDVVATVNGVVESGPEELDRVVKPGDPVAKIRTPDGKLVSVPSPISGTVVALGTSSNAPVQPGETLVTLAHDSAPMIGIVFAPTSTVPGITIGDPVFITPVSSDPSSEGQLTGKVSEVTRLPVSTDRVESMVTDPALTAQIMESGIVHEITITLDTVPGDPTKLVWTGGPGPAKPPASGEIVDTQIQIDEQTPWQALVGGG